MAQAETEQEVVIAEEEGNEQPSEQKKKSRFRITFRLNSKKKAVGRDTREEPQDLRAPEAAEAVVEEKPKKEKKVKPPKEKKPKPPKEKKLKPPKGEGQKKRLPVFAVALCSGAAGVALGIIGIMLFTGALGKPLPEEMIAKGTDYMLAGEYEKAAGQYGKVIAMQDEVPVNLLAEAYLGQGEACVFQEKTAEAILTFETGWNRTGDERLKQRLDELTKPPESPEEETDPEPEPIPEDPIVWGDPAFEQMVRLAVGNESGPIVPSDLAEITQLKIVGGTHAVINAALSTLNYSDYYVVDDVTYDQRGEITSLADVRNFPNLKRLIVTYNHIASLDGVESLANLEMLAVYFNDITDLTALSGLQQLKHLFLYDNRISDISPLRGLTSLTSLWLRHNQISDISPLAGLANLQELFVTGNQITDVSMLGNLKSLRFLYAEDNQINDIAVVEEMPALTDIAFQGNPVADYAPAAEIENVNQSYSSLAPQAGV